MNVKLVVGVAVAVVSAVLGGASSAQVLAQANSAPLHAQAAPQTSAAAKDAVDRTHPKA